MANKSIPVFPGLEEDLRERAHLLVKIRWGSISLFLFLLFLSRHLYLHGFYFQILTLLIGLAFLFNIAFLLDLSRPRTGIRYLRRVLNIQIYFDLFLYLTVFHLTGGIESPFFILLVFPATSAAVVFAPPLNFLHLISTFSLFALVLYLHSFRRLNPPFIMTLTAREKAIFLFFALGGVLSLSFYLTSSLITRLRERLKNLILLQKSLEKTYLDTVMALAQAVEAKDPKIKDHLERSIRYATLIGKELGLNREDMEALKFGAILHDIGKIGVNGNILFKKGPLTPEEYERIKKHPEMGVRIINGVDFLQRVEPIIRYHHERYDGKGYPEGKKGEEIPLLARIMSVVDAYEAMTSDRPYKKAMSREEAKRELLREKGKQFDPLIVDIFLKKLEEEK